jgi:hypothetical protein
MDINGLLIRARRALRVIARTFRDSRRVYVTPPTLIQRQNSGERG